MLWTDQGGVTEDPYVWFMEKEARVVLRNRLKMTDRIFGMVDWRSHGGGIEQDRKKLQSKSTEDDLG